MKKILIPLVIIGVVGISGYYVFTLSRPAEMAAQTRTKTIDTVESPERLMARAGWLFLEGRKAEANEIYRRVVLEHTDRLFSHIAEARLKEEGLIPYFKSLNESNAEYYTVKPGDSLARIAQQFEVTPGLVREANFLKDDRIYPAQTLKILKEPLRVLVDKSTNILILKAGDRVVKTYAVGTGKESGTPVGDFTIINRLKNPTWYYEGTVAQPNAPDNPLGTRWMGFDLDGYGLHGTTDPESIGKFETLGCIRMFNRDVEELFELLPVGTSVSVIESAVETAS